MFSEEPCTLLHCTRNTSLFLYIYTQKTYRVMSFQFIIQFLLYSFIIVYFIIEYFQQNLICFCNIYSIIIITWSNDFTITYVTRYWTGLYFMTKFSLSLITPLYLHDAMQVKLPITVLLLIIQLLWVACIVLEAITLQIWMDGICKKKYNAKPEILEFIRMI